VIETDIKTPKQARAEVTVSHISEAAIQLLNCEQDPQFTTNHIAERSGFSIGTIYRYFPNKEAIFRFVAKREISRTKQKLTDFIAQSDAATPHEFLDGFVGISATIFGGRPKAAHRFRKLAQNDPDLVRHANAVRQDICGSLSVKLSALDPDAFRPLDQDELKVVAEVFKSTMTNLGQMAKNPSIQKDTKINLIYGIMSAFAIDVPAQK